MKKKSDPWEAVCKAVGMPYFPTDAQKSAEAVLAVIQYYQNELAEYYRSDMVLRKCAGLLILQK